jgi:hypothetical protein
MSPSFATSLLESIPVFFAAYEVDYTFFKEPIMAQKPQDLQEIW